jgi:deazaflavin-dependent oxidoreductase (nitroreductase family)
MADQDFRKALERTREIQLTVTGRRTGRESSRPVWFVQEGDKLYVVPVTGSDSQWYRNVLKTPTVRIAADGAQVAATATPVTEPAKLAEVLDKLRAKHGDRDVAAYYPKQDAAVEVTLP